MDLWIVAAAAGAGYVAKYWQNLSGESESSSGNSFPMQHSESRNLLQQIRDQTCPIRRLSRNGFDVFSMRGDDFSDGKFDDASRGLANGGYYENYDFPLVPTFPPGFQGKESFQENLVGISGKNEGFDNFGDFIPDGGLTRSRPLRSVRSSVVRPLNSLESSLTAQLYRDQEREEDYVFSSVPLLLTPTVRPLLVTDGNGRIKRERIGSFGGQDGGKERRLKSKVGISLDESSSSTLLGTNSSQQRHGKGRLRSSRTSLSRGPFHTQGSSIGMLLFFIGITIGIMSAVIANKREVTNLNELLKKRENLVRDLHEELEMKDMLTVKELAAEYHHQSRETVDCSSCNAEPVSSSSKQESAKHKIRKADDNEVENCELMSKIEAELEAELERLELNMKASTLERISDVVELDPDFEADVVQGDLRVDLLQPGGGKSDSESDPSGASTNHLHTAANYAVSPRELRLRLHEVIERRLEARISELEAALQNSQRKAHSLSGSKSFINEVHDMKINLLNEGLDVCNEAYEEIMRVTESDQDTPDAVRGYNHIEKLMPC